MGHQAILETDSETECWLLQQHGYNYFLHFSFCFILIIPRLAELRPLTCNLEKCYSLRLSFGMYNIERQSQNLYSLTRHCPCNFLLEPTSPKHEYIGKL